MSPSGRGMVRIRQGSRSEVDREGWIKRPETDARSKSGMQHDPQQPPAIRKGVEFSSLRRAACVSDWGASIRLELYRAWFVRTGPWGSADRLFGQSWYLILYGNLNAWSQVCWTGHRWNDGASMAKHQRFKTQTPGPYTFILGFHFQSLAWHILSGKCSLFVKWKQLAKLTGFLWGWIMH